MLYKKSNIKSCQYYETYKDQLKDLCKPLEESLGINHFGYLRVYYEDAKYFYTSTCETLTKIYLMNVESSDIFFDKFLVNDFDNSPYKLILWPLKPQNKSMEIYLDHNYWNGITIANFDHPQYIELWWFATHPNNKSIIDFTLKYHNFLINLVISLNNKMSRFINIKDDELALYNKGFSFNIPDENNSSTEHQKIKAFLKEFTKHGIEIKSKNGIVKLTNSQIESLGYLAQGMSSKQIASVLNNSSRTIESHIKAIREKTGYNLKSDLTKLFNEQIKGLIL
jgi:DNA-binding CsgD family transcriptional regulator